MPVQSKPWIEPFKPDFSITKGLVKKETNDNCVIAVAQKIAYLAAAVFTAAFEVITVSLKSIANVGIAGLNKVHNYFYPVVVEETKTEEPKKTEEPAKKKVETPAEEDETVELAPEKAPGYMSKAASSVASFASLAHSWTTGPLVVRPAQWVWSKLPAFRAAPAAPAVKPAASAAAPAVKPAVVKA